MKKYALLMSIVAVSTVGLAEMVTVTDQMDTLSSWSANANWTTTGGIAETTSDAQFMTLQTGVAAPEASGDWVSAKIKQRVTLGSAGLSAANQYASRIAISGDATGASGLAKSMWTRRDADAVPGQIWGSAVSVQGATPNWKFGGWNNISEIGLSSTTNAMSDWFTSEIVITKTETAYDVVINYYDGTDAVVWTDSLAGTDLGDLANSGTWYLNMGSEYQFTTSADVAKLEVDQATLTSSIPEPATLGLVAAFGGAVLFIRRRFML
ncbi:PEP-CTERM sorting domain-containing protein [Pontiella agarivorans]|uniref:PEP-CTERM sorting domain-containing protein n=1 Tax=Pontiella agarivorans TaxID=3038953 RepID=A0ABU5MTM7_9BACT|nr:PEP-CTERM sorting domain-containing protein [Pontiella agarivorans]MDZ8117436.1 PEP-CTERM sorting domain-containing protein [Pontiella agarivorans]